jgi:hypothetical protein
VEGEIGVTGSIPSLLDRLDGARVVPIVSSDTDGVPAAVLARELPVVAVEGSVLVDELGEVTDDFLVKAELVPLARCADDVAFETVQASTELLPEDDLSLDVTSLLDDNPEKVQKLVNELMESAGSRAYLLAISWRRRRRC